MATTNYNMRLKFLTVVKCPKCGEKTHVSKKDKAKKNSTFFVDIPVVLLAYLERRGTLRRTSLRSRSPKK